MVKKIDFISACTLLLIFLSICVPLTLAQVDYWGYSKISAYATNVNDYSTSSVNTYRYEFTIADPPTGSNLTNTIEVRNDDTGENYSINLSIGDVVYLDYEGLNPTEISVNPTSDPDYYTVIYEGEVLDLQVNSILIPEFPPVLIAPIFMMITLLVIIYRKKG
jgi:hypothetical protein